MSTAAIAGTASAAQAPAQPGRAPLARRLLGRVGRPVDEPQDRFDALVGDVDPEERRGHLERRERRRDHEGADRDNATARATRSHVDSGSVVTIRHQRSSVPSIATGRTSDAAAAATTRPRADEDPAERAQVAEEGAHTALAAARSSGSSNRPRTIALATV